MSSFCLFSRELFPDNQEIPPHLRGRVHGNYAIACLELIFNFAGQGNLYAVPTLYR